MCIKSNKTGKFLQILFYLNYLKKFEKFEIIWKSLVLFEIYFCKVKAEVYIRILAYTNLLNQKEP